MLSLLILGSQFGVAHAIVALVILGLVYRFADFGGYVAPPFVTGIRAICIVAGILIGLSLLLGLLSYAGMT